MTNARSSTGQTLEVKRFEDRMALGAAAASDIADFLREVLANGPVRMVLASAPSQWETLQALAAMSGIDWSRVTVFHMDEYIGLDPSDERRFGNWLVSHFIEHVSVGAFLAIEPGEDAAAEAERYAALLAAAPIDLVCLGIGVNGHIAFNDPPVADFVDPLAVKVVELDRICRQQQVDEECFATIDEVPTHALTLTVPRLLDAGRMFCMVPGANKREAVAATLNGPLTPNCPASVLRTHRQCTLYLDSESDPR